MKRIELLTVEDAFPLSNGRGMSMLIITPDFSVPKAGWKERMEAVTIVKPDGGEIEATATISLSHFNIRDPDVSIDRRWRVTILFANRTKEDVPAGSRIFVSRETGNALLDGNG